MSIPPFGLIPRMQSKIQQNQIHTVTLITLSWQAFLWYLQVLGMLIRRPILIPSSTTLLVDQKANLYPCVEQNSYVSGMVGFREGLSPSQEGKVLWEITNQPGRSGLASLTHGKLIHFDAL